MRVWLVTSWYGQPVPFRLPPGVGSIRLVDSETTWVNGAIAEPPDGIWVWAMRPSVARRYTSSLPGREHLLVASGGHPTRIGARRRIPLLKNRPWCQFLLRKLEKLRASAEPSSSAPSNS